MRDLHDLLAAVLAAPDDPAPQLVYSDALLESGDARGELIAVEHRLELAPEPALLERRRQLRRAHGRTWWRALAPRFVRTRWGFAQAVAVRPEALEACAALAACEPIRAVEVYGAPLPPEAVAALPPVPELALGTATQEAFEALLEAPPAATLVSLDLSGSRLVAFQPRGRLPRCRRLALAATEVSVGDLLGWEHFRRLRALDVSATGFDPYELAQLLRALPELAVLRASNLDLSLAPGSLEPLAAALAASPRLVRAELVGCGLSEPESAALRRAAPHVELSTDPGRRALVLDLVGETFELVPEGERAWRVQVDGVPRAVDCAFTQSDSIGFHTRRGADGEGALGLLADALACGFPRRLTDAGFEVEARLLPRDNNVEASLTLGEAPAPVGLVLEHYVD